MMEKLSEFFLGSRRRALLTGAVIFCLVSGSDYLLRNEISIDVFYFLPIFILTWRGSRRWGIGAAAAGVVVWLTDERLFSPGLDARLNIVAWNAVVRMAFFSAVVFLVSELKSIVAKERAAARLKSAMIHTVSHEFNNSLTGLSTGLFLIRETDLAAMEENRGKIYDSMELSLHNLTLYVKNILNEARMEEGRFKIEKRPVALRELAAAASATMAELLAQRSIKLEMHMPEDPVMVNADREALALVISNLMGNAVKYTRTGGTIAVRITPAGSKTGGPPEKVLFAVEDSGIGISLEDLNKITDGFYRTAEGQAQASGFGLGLKISSELLALHDSRLEILSEKGKGSRFFFELPALRPAAKA